MDRHTVKTRECSRDPVEEHLWWKRGVGAFGRERRRVKRVRGRAMNRY